MQRDAQSKSTCRQTSEQSAGSYEATRRREFRKKFVPTLPPFCSKEICSIIIIVFTFFVLSHLRLLHLLRQFSVSRSWRLLSSPAVRRLGLYGPRYLARFLWSRRMSSASAFIYRHSACLSVGVILSQYVLRLYLGPHGSSTSSCHCQF